MNKDSWLWVGAIVEVCLGMIAGHANWLVYIIRFNDHFIHFILEISFKYRQVS